MVFPGGGRVDYVMDGLQRRIGRKVNGTLAQGFVYQDGLRVIAELDGVGQVLSRFVHGEKPNVPEYMVKGGITYRLITDHLGSVRLVVNAANGQIAQRICHFPPYSGHFVSGVIRPVTRAAFSA